MKNSGEAWYSMDAACLSCYMLITILAALAYQQTNWKYILYTLILFFFRIFILSAVTLFSSGHLLRYEIKCVPQR